MATSKKNSETNTKKSSKLSGEDEAAEFMNALEHAQKKEIEEVRKIILSANNGLAETIKWNAPNYSFKDEDRITFNFHGKGYFLLIFHCGAKAKQKKEKGRLFNDTTKLLEWITDDRATVKFESMSDVIAKQGRLTEVINKWLEVTT
jgi:hypothetical protein